MSAEFADLFDSYRDDGEWYEMLTAMLHSQYLDFVGYTFDRLEVATDTEFVRVRGLLLAFARKDHEAARFMADLTDEQRESSLHASNAHFELARKLYPEQVRILLDKAREGELKHGDDFGWPSTVFQVTGPQEIFRAS